VKIRGTAVAIAIMTPTLLNSSARAQGTEQTCTAQWLVKREGLPEAVRFKRSEADAFGRRCMGVSGPKPIDWNQVTTDLNTLIGPNSPLVGSVPTDIAVFCPGYELADRMQRAEFWRRFAAAVIRPEAGTNSNALMWEQPMRAGHPVGGEFSVGLLQLSISNRRPYGCDIPTEASLLNPSRNLACGVKIMEFLVPRGGIGGDKLRGNVGLARYWSTVRSVEMKPGAAGHRETRQPIIEEMRRLPQCSIKR
jgi:hypothetical protein